MKTIAKRVTSRVPRPGERARGTRTGRPIMVLLDLLGRRFALRVIWELRGPERLNFRALAAASGASPGVLNARLSELRENEIIDHDGAAGYGLTKRGRELLERLAPLHDWAETWARR